MLQIDSTFVNQSLSGNIDDYPEGLVFAIDKPYRWTSADVIRKIKFAAIRHFGKKNLKVGHAGTLDPLATGVLLVCIGNACKNAEKLQSSDKEYIADVVFGGVTASYDLEKEVECGFPVAGVTRESIEAVLPSFVGVQDQVAPLFSAKMIDGKRAYELARKMHSEGQPLDEAAKELLRVNRIEISSIDFLDYHITGRDDASAAASGASSRINVASLPEGLPCATIRIACSKGTYIRALARDLGEALGSAAFLGALQRSRSGSFDVKNALSIDKALELL